MSTDPSIRAALTWDVPFLRANGNAAFTRVFKPSADQFEDEVFESQTLHTAARALQQILFGDAARGEELAESIDSQPGDDASFLKAAVRAWPASVPDVDALTSFARMTLDAEVDDAYKVRLLLKAATFALDARQVVLFEPLCQEMRDRVPKDTPLHRQVEIVCQQLLGETFPRFIDAHGAVDPLVDLDWIDWAALASARETLDLSLERKSRSAWTETIHFGGPGPLETGVSAELAATWAGALWLRRPIQKQLAQEAISRDLIERDEWATYAATKWVASRERFSKISDVLEPFLPIGAADEVLNSVPSVAEVDVLTGHLLFDAYSDLWDLITTSRCQQFVRESRPIIGDHPNLRNLRAAWTLMALRVPDDWTSQFWGLDEDEQISLLDSVTGWTAQHIPPEPAAALFSVVLRSGAEAVGAIGGEWWSAVAGLAKQANEPFPEELFASLPPGAVVSLAEQYRPFVADTQLIRAISDLARLAEEDLVAAESGTINGYTQDPRSLLGRAMVALGETDPGIRELLVRTVTDENVPIDYRQPALSALWRLTFNHLLDPNIIEETRDAPLGGLAAFSAQSQESRFRAYLVAIQAWFEGTKDLAGQFFLLSRDEDPLVRAIVVESAGLLAKTQDDPTLALIPMNALFDPSRDVMRVGVKSVPSLPEAVIQDQTDVIVDRFSVALRSRDRRTRSEVVVASQLLVDRGIPLFNAYVTLGKQDASWIVRRDATREGESNE